MRNAADDSEAHKNTLRRHHVELINQINNNLFIDY